MQRSRLFVALAILLLTPVAPRAVAAASLDSVPAFELAPVERNQLLAEDASNAGPGVPVRYALPVPVEINPQTHGAWEDHADGRRTWRLRVVSPGASNLSFGFTRYAMPEGGVLRVYSADKAHVLRPFTAADNAEHGELWTPILPAAEVVLEVELSAAVTGPLGLELTTIGQGYRSFEEAILSGSCNVDVICPEGDGWRDQIRSVAVIGLGASTFCTGFMVNNTAQDLTPYFMTADHCGIGSGNAASLVVYWNYENTTCRTPGSPQSGGPGDGSLAQFQTGSFFRAGYGPSDFTLVELDEDPNPDWNVHFAGWNRDSGDFSGAIAIHHPSTDEKRISFENDPTTTTSYLGSAVPGDGTHVRVADWDLGTTEGGSSGSPLFDPAGRVVGQLHGGFAACGNNDADWYGRISVSWNGGGTSASRLSDWLDPTSSGVTTLDGRDLSAVGVSPAVQAVCAPDDAVFDLSVAEIGGSSNPVTLSVTGAPAGTTTTFSTNPVSPPATPTLTVGNTGAASAGSYPLQIDGTSTGGTESAAATLDLFTTVPGASGLTSPVDGAISVSIRPTLVWTAAAGAQSHSVELATDAGFTNVVASADVDGTSYSLMTDLATETTYYWRVRADNVCGASAWSSTWSFTTAAAPGSCGSGAMASTLYAIDFETGGGGWTGSGTGSTWALSTARAHGGSTSYFAANSSSVSDQYLVSPGVSLPASGQGLTLQFWNYQDLEDRTGGCYDGAVLEILVDGVGVWTRLDGELLTDPYDGPISADFSSPLGGEDAWCGSPQDWLNSVVDLQAYAGETVFFRFRLATDSSQAEEGWYLDDVLVQECLSADAIFSDGFEAGNVSAWSSFVSN